MPEKSTPRRGRGRPAHVPTAATRRTVSIAAGGGMLHEHIAVALEISVDTLRKYYQAELAVGSTKRRMDVLQAMYKAATTKGSTSAAKVYLANEPQLAVPPLTKDAEAPAPAPVETPVVTPKRGKKEQANIDAVTAAAGTDWADLLPGAAAPRSLQ